MNETSLLDLMKTRRSIRKYSSRAVEPALLEQIVRAGQYAPTGKGRQNTAFVIIENPEMIHTLSLLNAQAMQPASSSDPFYGAPAVIAVLADARYPTWIQDASAAAENILLAAHALGLGSCWINRAKEVFETEEGRKIADSLDIPATYQGLAFVTIGYPEQNTVQVAPRKSLVRWIK